MLTWTSAHATDVGARRKINEDAVMARPEDGFWAVADGMGGHAAGDVASSALAHALTHVAFQSDLADFVDAIDDAVLAVNGQLREYARSELSGRTMGTTVVSLVLGEHTGACLWVGDSRLYRLRQGELRRLSHDHSAVQELVDAGVISAEQAAEHPQANVITRAVGAAEEMLVATVVFAPEPGDTYLLCSDGLYNEVPEPVIGRHLDLPAEAATKALLADALAAGARDNVSVVVVKLREAE